MKAAKAQEWRPEESPFDTAPPPPPPRLNPADWGVTVDEARDMLSRQMCPACGEGPWKSPLNHASRKHGFDRFSMRDACGLTLDESVLDPALAERFIERGKRRDMSAVNHKGKARKRQRWTGAGRRATAANLEGVTAEQSRAALARTRTPEAQARRSATLRGKWAAATPEQRAEWGARVGGDQEHMDKMRRALWEKRGLQPCGTVAAYKRGCRCDACRDAKRASRR